MSDSDFKSGSPSQPAEEATNSISAPAAGDPSTDSAPPIASSSSASSSAAPAPLPPPKAVSSFTAPYNAAPAPITTAQFVRPNSAIPQFIRVLAVVVFLGGSVASLLTWLYKAFLYPRLLIALNAKTSLFQGHLTSYTTFLHDLRLMAKGKGYSLIAPKVTLLGPDQQTLEKMNEPPLVPANVAGAPDKPEKPEKKEKDEEEVVKQEGDEEETPEPPKEPAPQIFEPLLESLHSITAAVPHPPTVPSAALDSLSNKLSVLTDYITQESFHSYASTYRINASSSIIPGDGGGSHQKIVQESVNNLKAEIRQVKGALLNRRNFASLTPRGSSANLTTLGTEA